MLSLGIDASATATGFVLVDEKRQTMAAIEFRPKTNGLQRCSEIAEEMLRLLSEYHPDVVVIEGLGFANAHSLVTLAEVHVILRYFLWQSGRGFVQVAPAALKKFATGKGNSPKDLVIKEVFKRWGFDTSSNNLADAYALAVLGVFFRKGSLDLPKYQLDVLGGLAEETPS